MQNLSPLDGSRGESKLRDEKYNNYNLYWIHKGYMNIVTLLLFVKLKKQKEMQTVHFK